jgi:hypothetical protein
MANQITKYLKKKYIWIIFKKVKKPEALKSLYCSPGYKLEAQVSLYRSPDINKSS